MARPIKQGIDYFPLDVDFLRDIKVRKIMRACGTSSIPVLIALLSNIYRDKGYYMEWNSEDAFLISDELGISEGVVAETVRKAVQVEFFNPYMFENHNVLTSKGIQKRYITAARLKTSVRYEQAFMLVNVSNVKKPVSNVENPISNVGNAQRKVNQRKDKVKENTPPALPVLPDGVRDEAQQLLGSISPTAYQQLMEWRKSYGDDWICEALSIARIRDCRSLAYAGGILKRWKGSGYDGSHQSGSGARRAPAPGRKSSGDGSGVNWDDIPERL